MNVLIAGRCPDRPGYVSKTELPECRLGCRIVVYCGNARTGNFKPHIEREQDQ